MMVHVKSMINPYDLPLVSVIIPCYNQAIFLSETLLSVLAQTYSNWECIIVNDGSTDDTVDVANSFLKRDGRFSLISIPNGGLANARNVGIRASSGLYVLPLDSDDIIAESYLSDAISVFSEHKNIDIVYARARLFGKVDREWHPEKMLAQNCVYCSAMYKREMYNQTVGYNSNMKYGFEDWDFWLSMIELGANFYMLDKVLFFYRIRSASMRTAMDSSKLKFSRKQIWENHKQLYSKFFFDPLESYEIDMLTKSIEYKIAQKILFPLKRICLFKKK